ncbi:hypothetical protein BaRGS_00023752 [Batillaria attramentaria]|uniref:Uncharacterized protein n=1 Tax=Batillaria attramentaria TaxID=370345 RepID=A0ABD0KCY0_9CAEN
MNWLIHDQLLNSQFLETKAAPFPTEVDDQGNDPPPNSYSPFGPTSFFLTEVVEHFTHELTSAPVHVVMPCTCMFEEILQETPREFSTKSVNAEMDSWGCFHKPGHEDAQALTTVNL